MGRRPKQLHPDASAMARFGYELRRWRALREMTQTGLGSAAGFSHTYVSLVENGHEKPSLPFVRLVDQALQAEGALLALYGHVQAEHGEAKEEARELRERALALLQDPDTVDLVVLDDLAKAGELYALFDRDGPTLHADGAATSAEEDQDMKRRSVLKFAGVAGLDLLGNELWELSAAVDGRSVEDVSLPELKANVTRLDRAYGKVAPHELLPKLRSHQAVITGLLKKPVRLPERRQLYIMAAHLAGLRGWLAFDLADQIAARAWWQAGLQTAAQAEAHSLAGWIVGNRSMIPTYEGEAADALKFIHVGRRFADRGTDATVKAWLASLEARALAGLGDERGFREAEKLAASFMAHARPEERKHGMDFKGSKPAVTLFYEGSSRMLLRKPKEAQPILLQAMALQGPRNLKARATVRLCLATTYAQQRNYDGAVGMATEALSIPDNLRTGPIMRRVVDFQRELASAPKGVRSVDVFREFARAL
jgi:transcriptional regulator with XRE-family HTH domain